MHYAGKLNYANQKWDQIVVKFDGIVRSPNSNKTI